MQGRSQTRGPWARRRSGAKHPLVLVLDRHGRSAMSPKKLYRWARQSGRLEQHPGGVIAYSSLAWADDGWLGIQDAITSYIMPSG